MFSSVRVRLTFWYTGAMTVVVVALAVTTYLVLRQNVIRRADAAAIELADSFVTTVEAETGGIGQQESLSSGIAAAISEHRFRDVLFIVLDSKRKILGKSEIDDKHLRLDDATWVTVADRLENASTSTIQSAFMKIGNRDYRGYTRSLSVDGQTITLIVLQSLREQNEFLENLAATFAVVIPLAMILAAAGGYTLARKSLSPVVAMSVQASHIGSENLHDRLVVRNSQDELGRLATSFNQLLDRLSESFERHRRFVADASHELRTPVAILYGEAEVTLSREARTEGEYRESLEILREESRRLKHIVEDLFTLARADAGQHPLVLSDFYLDELALECAKKVRTLAAAKNIAIACQSAKELLICADKELLSRMLLNLLDNAIKYTPSSGGIMLRCNHADATYRLSVEDSGQGIPSELQSKIFERFFRVDKARSRSESDSGGAGLGLAIASWIAAAHDGKIELSSSTAQGSVFTATLPKKTA